jgi:hypothetical protein
MPDRQTTARQYIIRDLDEALALVADARKLMPHARYRSEAAADLHECLDRAERALESAKEGLPDD